MDVLMMKMMLMMMTMTHVTHVATEMNNNNNNMQSLYCAEIQFMRTNYYFKQVFSIYKPVILDRSRLYTHYMYVENHPVSSFSFHRLMLLSILCTNSKLP